MVMTACHRMMAARAPEGLRCGVLLMLVGGLVASACARSPEPSSVTLSACSLPGIAEPSRCGVVEVPENRSARDGRVIQLRIAVLPSTGGQPLPDPIFVLVGGPGQSAVANAATYADLLAPLRTNRAVVLVDQRGTGGSNPLPCDLYSAQPAGSLGDFMPTDAVRACRRALEPLADLRFYSSEDAAEDLDAVRAALGYDRINIEAASYGTRVALLYLRRHPEQVRSAVLRSVSPPWMKQPLSFAADAQAALDSLMAACRADAPCHRAFPRFAEDLRAVFARLEAGDVTVELPAIGDSTPARTVSLSRDAFAEKLRLMLYSPGLASLLPLLVRRAASGDFGPYGELADDIGRQIAALGSNGMYLSVTCTEDVARITAAEAANTWPGTFLGDYRVRQQRAACALWPTGSLSADFAEPIRSSVPVLLMSSPIDPITPPRWADEAARGLAAARHILVPNAGHSPSGQCVMDIERQFFASASTADLDPGCLDHLRRPPFALELPR